MDGAYASVTDLREHVAEAAAMDVGGGVTEKIATSPGGGRPEQTTLPLPEVARRVAAALADRSAEGGGGGGPPTPTTPSSPEMNESLVPSSNSSNTRGGGAALDANDLDRLACWRADLMVGAPVDALARDGIWYAGKIAPREKNDAPESEGILRVKYKGFKASRYDDLIPRASMNLQPLNTWTKVSPQAKRKRKKGECGEEAGRLEQRRRKECADWLREDSVGVVVTTGRSGRKRKVRIETFAAPAPAKKAAKKKQKEGKENKAAEDTKQSGTDDSSDYVCSVCTELESGEEGLLCCDGPCNRSFHLACVSLDTLPAGDWFCQECTAREHTCFACGVAGADDAPGGVFKCRRGNCGRFYHYQCARRADGAEQAGCFKFFDGAAMPYRHDDDTVDQNGDSGAAGGSDGDEAAPEECPFECAQHTCATCGIFYRNAKAKGPSGKLHTCFLCPSAYHVNCIPPTARFNEFCVLCPNHADVDLPEMRPEMSLLFDPSSNKKQTFVHDIGRNMQQAHAFVSGGDVFTDLIARLPPSPKAKQAKRDAADPTHYRLPYSVLDDAQSKPDEFRHTERLIDVNCLNRCEEKIATADAADRCRCVGSCDDQCLNHVSGSECVGGGPAEDAANKKKKHHAASNCAVGRDCGNRQLQQPVSKRPKTEIFRTPWKGWGLRVQNEVEEGQLIAEYVGEVISEQEMERRMVTHNRERPHDHNMYVMELHNCTYVDARLRGNYTRFINHSCDPNCELHKMRVQDRHRIGIYARHAIPAGTELTYDYKFFTQDASAFRCMCGGPSCRGTLSTTRLTDSAGGGGKKKKKLLKGELMKLLKKQEKKQMQEQERKRIANNRRVSLTGAALPGSAVELVRNGPSSVAVGREARVFLKRSLQRGKLLRNRRDAWRTGGTADSAFSRAAKGRNGRVVVIVGKPDQEVEYHPS